MSRLKKTTAHVLVCTSKTCLRQGGKAVIKQLKHTLKEQDLCDRVMITKVKCLDQCGRGPVLAVYPDGVWYGGVEESGAREIVEQHLACGRAAALRILRDMRGEAGDGR